MGLDSFPRALAAELSEQLLNRLCSRNDGMPVFPHAVAGLRCKGKRRHVPWDEGLEMRAACEWMRAHRRKLGC